MGWWRAVVVVVLTGCAVTTPVPDGGAASACDGVTCTGGALCDATTGACVTAPSCGITTGCPAGATCLASGVCASCGVTFSCVGVGLRCNGAACAGCGSDTDCPPDAPRCDHGSCAQCLADADCPSTTPRCKLGACVRCTVDADCPAPARCAFNACVVEQACTRDADCPAVAPRCSVGTCQECHDLEDCAAGESCSFGDCRPTIPGELCSSALTVTLRGTTTLVEGYSGTRYPNQDVYFVFSLAADAWLSASVTPSPGSFADVSLLAGDCPGQWIPARTFAPAGTYRAVVRSRGAFTLSLTQEPATRPVGAECLLPEVLALDANGQASREATSIGDWATPSSLNPACEPGAIPQHIYAIDLPLKSEVRARVVPLDANSKATASVRATCIGANVECPATYPAGQAKDHRLEVGPGRAFVFAGAVMPPGAFRLEVTATPLAINGTCDTASPLVFDGGLATATGDTTFARAGECPCLSSCNHQQQYRLDTRGLGERSLEVRAEASDGGRAPALSLNAGCPSSAVVCDGFPQEGPQGAGLSVPRLPEGEYFVQVNEGSGPFSLSVVVGPSWPKPVNDTCATATVIDLTATPAATVTGTTRGASDDTRTCDTLTGGQTADVAYLLRTPPWGLLEVEATPTAPDYDLSLEATAVCGSIGSSPCSAQAGPGLPERVSLMMNGAGAPTAAVNVLVDGLGHSSGPFTLQARFTPPPANDLCAAAITLTQGTPVSGTTRVGRNELDCGTTGPDVFYRFTAPSNGTYTFTLAPADFDGALRRVATCASTSCAASADSAGVGGSEQLTLQLARNEVAWLAVDSAWVSGGAGGGSFTLSVP